MLDQRPGDDVRVFVVWEPILPTDLGPPGDADLARCADPRARQLWDPQRLTSHAISSARGEPHKVWDWVAVFPPGTTWGDRFPAPAFSDGPVDTVTGPLRAALGT